jgi:hypothetical protein
VAGLASLAAPVMAATSMNMPAEQYQGHGHTLLDAKAEGPFMLVDLPPGRYSIHTGEPDLAISLIDAETE